MKVISFIFSLLLSSLIMAQDGGSFFSGARFAMGSSEFKEFPSEENSEVNTKLSFALGVNANYFFNRSIGLGTDIMLNFMGSEVDGTESGNLRDYDYKDKYSIIRLELPILAKLAIPVSDNFSFVGFGGPSFDFNLAGNYQRNYKDDNGPNDVDQSIDNLETISTSFKFGGGIMIESASGQIFMLDARISRDISDFLEGSNGGDSKLGYFAFSVGVGF